MAGTPSIREVLVMLFADVEADVEVFQLDRAYQTAAGPMLSVATRTGWPQADLFLDFALAVRALIRDNRTPLAREDAQAHYARTAAKIAERLGKMT